MIPIIRPTLREISEVVNRKSDVPKVEGLHPETAWRCLSHVREALAAGVLFGIAQGVRSAAQQAVEYAKGRDAQGAVVDRRKVVTWARPGYSFHQYGLAYDVVLLRPHADAGAPYEVEWNPFADLDKDGVRDYLEIGLAGERVGLEWGGRWVGKYDGPHFEFTPNLPIEVAVGRFPGFKVPDDYFERAA